MKSELSNVIVGAASVALIVIATRWLSKSNANIKESAAMRVFRITGALGAICLIMSFAWCYSLARRNQGAAALGIDISMPPALRVMIWFGFTALIVGASGISGSRLLKIASILGSVSLATGFGWLNIWDYLVVQRGTAAPWESPAAPIWMVGVGSALLATAGVFVIIVNGIRWGRTMGRKLQSNHVAQR